MIHLSLAGGRRAIGNILAQAPQTDGIFFATDVLAVGGLLECKTRDIPVPEQIALIGLGNLEIGRELQPALTTIEVPAYEMGRRAGEVVVARLARGTAAPGAVALGTVASGAAAPKIVDLGFAVLARDTT